MATTQVSLSILRKNSTNFTTAVTRSLLSDNILTMEQTSAGTLIQYDNPHSSMIDQYVVEELAYTIATTNMTAWIFGTLTDADGIATSKPYFINKLRAIEQIEDPNDADSQIVFFDAGRNHTAKLKELELFLVDTLGSTVAITAVSIANKTFTVATDLTASFPAGKSFAMDGSTANDGLYTVVSSVFGAATVITVVQDIADATVDGSLKY